MSNSRPEIPKKLASKIIAAQNKVLSARQDIHYNEERITQDQKRLDEYRANPSAFAAKYYGNNPPDSYPVQTNIERCREGIEYRSSRRSRYNLELISAESNLSAVEQDVLEEVKAMRASAGRVPWPKDLPTFNVYIADLVADRLAQEEVWAAEQEKERLQFEEWLRIEEQRIQAESDRDYAEAQEQLKETLSKLSEADKLALKQAMERLKDKIKSGEISIWEVFDYLQLKARA